MAVIVTPLRKPLDISDIKINGRCIGSLERHHKKLSRIKEDNTKTLSTTQGKMSPSGNIDSQKSSVTSLQLLAEQRRSDEKIIAEILKPEEVLFDKITGKGRQFYQTKLAQVN